MGWNLLELNSGWAEFNPLSIRVSYLSYPRFGFVAVVYHDLLGRDTFSIDMLIRMILSSVGSCFELIHVSSYRRIRWVGWGVFAFNRVHERHNPTAVF